MNENNDGLGADRKIAFSSTINAFYNEAESVLWTVTLHSYHRNPRFIAWGLLFRLETVSVTEIPWKRNHLELFNLHGSIYLKNKWKVKSRSN